MSMWTRQTSCGACVRDRGQPVLHLPSAAGKTPDDFEGCTATKDELDLFRTAKRNIDEPLFAKF